MKAIFVTGTDTGIGKTLIIGLLARQLMESGYNVITQKWIQSGKTKDINTHLKLMGISKKTVKKYLPFMEPYSFKFPASPHLAAKLEKRTINTKKIKKSFKVLQKQFDFVIVEGTGGALVPYNKKKLVIDIARELNMPVLIVVGNKLGAINHTLLTIEAIKKRKMPILGIIFNNIDKRANKVILQDNVKIIKKLTGERVLGTFY